MSRRLYIRVNFANNDAIGWGAQPSQQAQSNHDVAAFADCFVLETEFMSMLGWWFGIEVSANKIGKFVGSP